MCSHHRLEHRDRVKGDREMSICISRRDLHAYKNSSVERKGHTNEYLVGVIRRSAKDTKIVP